jgi:glycine dehydrogenase subunit 1
MKTLMANVFMTVYGKEGLKELARQNLAKTAYAVEQFRKAGATVLFEGAPRFNEFVVQTKADPYSINDRLLQQRILGGFPVLKRFYPELGTKGAKDVALWCCTELVSRPSIDAAAKAVAQ